MQEVKIDFDSSLELVTVVVRHLGFLVKPKTVLNGESAVLERLKSSRSYNPMAQEVTDDELMHGASMLMNTPGVMDWAKSKLQYQT